MLSHRDLHVIIRQAPRDSAIVRSVDPEAALYGQTEQLLAAAVDALHWANWAQTRDGHRGRNRPQPIPRPGVAGPEKFGRKPLPTDEMAAWLGWSDADDPLVA